MPSRRALPLLPFVAAILVGCGGGSSGSSGGNPPAPSPTIAYFTATPGTVAPGGASILAWSVANASALSIDHGVGAVTGSSVTVNPGVSTVYTLSATSASGTTAASVVVTVASPATYTLSGTVTGAAVSGVTVTLGGAASAVTTTDGAGQFSFPGLGSGTYTVTPTLAGYAFSPASMTVGIGGASVGGLTFAGSPVCSWTQAWQAPLSSMPAGGTARGGTAGTGWTFAAVGGRVAFTSGSDWEELTVPSGLAAGDDVFSAQTDFYASPVTLGAGAFRNTGLYVFTDLHSTGQNHGFWAGFREEGGLATQFEWVVGPTPLPATGWDAWDQNLGLALLAQSAALAIPAGGWHTLRIEGVRSACRFRALLDGTVISTWSPAACDLAGGTVAVASARVLPIGVAYSNLAVGRGSSAVCVP